MRKLRLMENHTPGKFEQFEALKGSKTAALTMPRDVMFMQITK